MLALETPDLDVKVGREAFDEAVNTLLDSIEPPSPTSTRGPAHQELELPKMKIQLKRGQVEGDDLEHVKNVATQNNAEAAVPPRRTLTSHESYLAANARHPEAGIIVASLIREDTEAVLNQIARLKSAYDDDDVMDAIRTALIILLHCDELVMREAATKALRLTAAAHDERLLCWGALNSQGGSGNMSQKWYREFDKTVSIRQVVCGAQFSQILSDDGAVYGWGQGDSGQLGNGNLIGSDKPSMVLKTWGEARIVSLAAGYAHSLACTDTGQVYAWGDGRFGQLGLGDARIVPRPERIHGLENDQIVSMGCGKSHSACVTANGRLYSMGANDYGQLGAGDKTSRRLPCVVIDMQGLNVVQVSCGKEHTLMRSLEGQLFAWGRGDEGQLGLHDLEGRNYPHFVDVGGLPVAMCAAGAVHSCACSLDGHVYTWGSNQMGQLGHLGNEVHISVPRRLDCFPGDIFMRQVTCGMEHTVAISTSGALFSWGRDVTSYKPDRTSLPKQNEISSHLPISSVRFASCGEFSTCVLTGS